MLTDISLGKATMLLSTALMLEYEAVCGQADHRKAAGLSMEETEVFLNALAFLSIPVRMHFHWRPQLKDIGDEMVLETAVNGGADALVTYNMKDYGKVPASFGIALLSPQEALKRIRT